MVVKVGAGPGRRAATGRWVRPGRGRAGALGERLPLRAGCWRWPKSGTARGEPAGAATPRPPNASKGLLRGCLLRLASRPPPQDALGAQTGPLIDEAATSAQPVECHSRRRHARVVGLGRGEKNRRGLAGAAAIRSRLRSQRSARNSTSRRGVRARDRGLPVVATPAPARWPRRRPQFLRGRARRQGHHGPRSAFQGGRRARWPPRRAPPPPRWLSAASRFSEPDHLTFRLGGPFQFDGQAVGPCGHARFLTLEVLPHLKMLYFAKPFRLTSVSALLRQ